MNFVRKLLGPRNSLVLVFDHLTDREMPELEAQVEEVGRYYRFAKLSEIGEEAARGKARGLAAIVFAHARKSLFLRALPLLRGAEIPVTVFVDPDCVGMNRLPVDEELHWFRTHYSDVFAEEELRKWRDTAWYDPKAAGRFLGELRARTGPLPLDSMDPTLFMATWGKIVEIPPELREVGLALGNTPGDGTAAGEALRFLRQQTGTAVTAARHPRAPEGNDVLRRLGVHTVLGPGRGAVVPGTDPGNLPFWVLERSVDDTAGP